MVLVTTSLLALTDSFTRAKLEAQQEQQTLEMLKGIFPEAGYYVFKDDIYIIYDNGRYEIGYAFFASGTGYGGKMVILVGLEDKETIKGITIISHRETEMIPIGEGIPGPPLDFSPFVGQFIGLKINYCDLKKDGGQVDAITGATYSSKAVVDIVRETALEKVKSIR